MARKRLSTFVRWKVYLDRARIYMTYLQMFMLVGLCYDMVARHVAWVRQHTAPVFGALVVLLVVGCMLVGWLDTKLGVLDEEIKQVYGDRLQSKGGE